MQNLKKVSTDNLFFFQITFRETVASVKLTAPKTCLTLKATFVKIVMTDATPVSAGKLVFDLFHQSMHSKF